MKRSQSLRRSRFTIAGASVAGALAGLPATGSASAAMLTVTGQGGYPGNLNAAFPDIFPFRLDLTYEPGSTASASVTSASLVLGPISNALPPNFTWEFRSLREPGLIWVEAASVSGTRDSLSISLTFGPENNTIGSDFLSLGLTIHSDSSGISSSEASSGNIEAIFRQRSSGGGGIYATWGSGNISHGSPLAVDLIPAPGAIAVLGAVVMVGSRRRR